VSARELVVVRDLIAIKIDTILDNKIQQNYTYNDLLKTGE